MNDVTASAFELKRTLTYVRSAAVADDAWYASPLSELTVGDYIKSIYRKLGVNSRMELVAKLLPQRA